MDVGRGGAVGFSLGLPPLVQGRHREVHQHHRRGALLHVLLICLEEARAKAGPVPAAQLSPTLTRPPLPGS